MRGGVDKATYRSWQMMKNRCLNPKAEDYAYYGGKGVSVDPAWHSYDCFLRDMGQRPPGTTIDRIDSQGDYTKSNCRWATRLTQARNRAYTLDVTHGGRTQKVWEWAAELRLSQASFHHRLWRSKTGQISEAKVFTPNPRKS